MCLCPYGTKALWRCLRLGRSLLPDTHLKLPLAVMRYCISSTVNSSVCQRAQSASTCFALHCSALSCKYRLPLCTQTVCFGPLQATSRCQQLSAKLGLSELQTPNSFRQQLSSCGAVEETFSQFYWGTMLHSRGKISNKKEKIQRVFWQSNQTVCFSTNSCFCFFVLPS